MTRTQNRRLFDFARIWYSLFESRDYRCTANVQGQVVKGQGHSVKTSSDRQSIAFSAETWAAESNDSVRILIDWQFVRMRSTNVTKRRRTTGRDVGRGIPQVAMRSQNFATLVVVITLRTSCANERSRCCFSFRLCVGPHESENTADQKVM